MPPTDNKSIGIAFQGGSFLAGAVETGVIQAFVKLGVFGNRNIKAFTGTSAGALVAAHCWCEALKAKEERDYPALAQKLHDFWLQFAMGTIPDQDAGDFWKSFDQIARLNPAYDALADSLRIPMIQGMFREWIKSGIEPEKTMNMLLARKDDSDLPRLAVGTADLLSGDIVTFADQDFVDAATAALTGTSSARRKKTPLKHVEFKELKDAWGSDETRQKAACAAAGDLMLSALMASGSLDEVNGTTIIETGPLAGMYVDGAWGQNPPLDVMIDMGIDEIWTIEIFPKIRELPPTTHREREDRKEELWQNAMVEQQIRMINKINELIESGLLISGGKYNPIKIRRLSMPLDFTPGARIVNDPLFLKKMMKIGENEATKFLAGF